MNNNAVSSWIRIVVQIGILLIAVGIAWATLNGDVKQNTKQGDIAAKRMSVIEEGFSVIKSDIRESKIRQEYIIKSVDEIKEELKNKER